MFKSFKSQLVLFSVLIVFNLLFLIHSLIKIFILEDYISLNIVSVVLHITAICVMIFMIFYLRRIDERNKKYQKQFEEYKEQFEIFKENINKWSSDDNKE